MAHHHLTLTLSHFLLSLSLSNPQRSNKLTKLVFTLCSSITYAEPQGISVYLFVVPSVITDLSLRTNHLLLSFERRPLPIYLDFKINRSIGKDEVYCYRLYWFHRRRGTVTMPQESSHHLRYRSFSPQPTRSTYQRPKVECDHLKRLKYIS